MAKAIFGAYGIQSDRFPLVFDDPLKTYSTAELGDVKPLLNELEDAAKSGYWVALMLSYEAAPAFDSSLKTHRLTNFPLVWAAVFSAPTNTDQNNGHYRVGQWTPLVTRCEYVKAIGRIHDLIARGHTYQVNYTFPQTSTFSGDALTWYVDLCHAQGAELCAYLDLGRYQVLSLSPELFFERKGKLAVTKPMKGTIKRGRWAKEDHEMSIRLKTSAKDRAENVMIVDLLRNDLGKVSVPGSVRVSQLFQVERFETLWQMTSTVESTLCDEVSLTDLFAALFPCGSITGAPKIRTMEIIRELESNPRGIYTGAIGLIRPGGDCRFNVAIRTVVIDAETGTTNFGVGGGITIDSTAEREYDECLLKSSFLNSPAIRLRLLETILLEGGELFLLERHLERLHASADYFGFQLSREKVLAALNDTAAVHSTGTWKVRLLVANSGEVEIETTEIKDDDDRPVRVCLASAPIDSSNRLLFHKTTNRKVYEDACAARSDCDDVVLWNERGEITESSIANIVVPMQGKLYTPPQSSGLLAGTFRAQLLAEGKIHERIITIEELLQSADLFLINSVRKWMPAKLVD